MPSARTSIGIVIRPRTSGVISPAMVKSVLRASNRPAVQPEPFGGRVPDESGG